MCRITVISSLYNCGQFLEGFLTSIETITNFDEIEILLLHNAPAELEVEIIHKFLPRLPNVRHIVIPERESLYSTWNKGVKFARGKYLTIWNADDVRLPDSLMHQADALDAFPQSAICYGDFIIVDRYGKKDGHIQIEPEFSTDQKSFLRKHHIGCFPMWRKEIHKSIGFFDEQFRLVADLDFQIRVSQQFPLVKVNKILGYYLENTPSNLSSNRKLQRTERTALNIRHCNFDLLHLPYIVSALKLINVRKYKWFGEFYKKKEWSEDKFSKVFIKSPLILISLFNLPLDILRYIKYAIPKS